MFGRELAADPKLTRLERAYIRIFGAPVQGLRVRAHHVLPCVPPAARNILDAGCGRGAFVLHLAARGRQVTGMDLDADRLGRARVMSRSLGLASARWVVADLLRPGLRPVFDAILCVDNLEHIEDDAAALGSLRRLLAPGGRLIVHVPARERRWLVFRWRENFAVPGHVRPGYTAEELSQKLRDAGFTIESLRATYGVLETLANNLSYLITGARERRRMLYALCFPLLLLLTALGRGARPARGAGILAVAR